MGIKELSLELAAVSLIADEAKKYGWSSASDASFSALSIRLIA